MNRNQLWQKMKELGITKSERPDCPPDADLKLVVQCTKIAPKAFVDFLLSIDKN